MQSLPLVVSLQAGGGQDPVSFLFPMAAIMLIFYFLLIRPQQKRQKEHDEMLQSVQKGDKVVTAGGLHGVVTGAADEVLTVEIAALKGERVRVKIDRAQIGRRLEKAEGNES